MYRSFTRSMMSWYRGWYRWITPPCSNRSACRSEPQPTNWSFNGSPGGISKMFKVLHYTIYICRSPTQISWSHFHRRVAVADFLDLNQANQCLTKRVSLFRFLLLWEVKSNFFKILFSFIIRTFITKFDNYILIYLVHISYLINLISIKFFVGWYTSKTLNFSKVNKVL